MNIERATATHGAGLNWSQVRRGDTLKMQVMLVFQVDFFIDFDGQEGPKRGST